MAVSRQPVPVRRGAAGGGGGGAGRLAIGSVIGSGSGAVSRELPGFQPALHPRRVRRKGGSRCERARRWAPPVPV